MENLYTKIYSVKGNFQQPFFMEIFHHWLMEDLENME